MNYDFCMGDCERRGGHYGDVMKVTVSKDDGRAEMNFCEAAIDYHNDLPGVFVSVDYKLSLNDIECAVFEYNEDGPGAYTIMVQRLKIPGKLMRRAGWRDGHIMFFQVDGGIEFGTIYPEVMSNKLTAADDDMLEGLLFAIRDQAIDIDEINELSIGPGGDYSVEEVTGIVRE